MSPARSNSLCETISASAGVSFNVGIRVCDQRIQGAESAGRITHCRLFSWPKSSSGRRHEAQQFVPAAQVAHLDIAKDPCVIIDYPVTIGPGYPTPLVFAG